jgi:SPP1 family predicted phage head-tail adaptor
MRSARLDRQIALQRSTVVIDESGVHGTEWQEYAVRRANVVPVRGEERFTGEQWAAREQVEFHIRWDLGVATTSPLDRVIYPVGEPVDASIYDVMAVHELGRHVGLRIMAARRTDVRP